jgi:hypothetical protein
VSVLLHDNILYFLGIAFVLVLSNIMAIGTAAIPWFGYGPFHGALGIMTTRMHIHLTKFLENDRMRFVELTQPIGPSLSALDFGSTCSTVAGVLVHNDIESFAEASSSPTFSTEDNLLSVSQP